MTITIDLKIFHRIRKETGYRSIQGFGFNKILNSCSDAVRPLIDLRLRGSKLHLYPIDSTLVRSIDDFTQMRTRAPQFHYW